MTTSPPAGTPAQPPALPAGCTTRPLTRADSRAVYEVIAAQELVDLGEEIIEEADLVADWQRPSYDLGASSVAVLEGEQVVAYAEVTGTGRGDAAVHPDHRGRGIGTWLAHWMQDRARSLGEREIGMPVPEGSPGDRLLAALGYRVRWTSWVLELPEGAEIAPRPLPAGYAVRAATPAEHEACWTVNEDAFLEWSVRPRAAFEDWRASVVQRPGFESWHLRVVTDADARVVAMAVVIPTETGEAYIDKLATRADQRGRGLAQALLADSFATARAHGCTRSTLSTDSRTGALGLYEKVGMRVTSRWVNRGIDV